MDSARVLLHPQFDDLSQQRDAARLGIWIFLATEILFFGDLLGGYAITRVVHAEAFALASKLTNVTLGSINTTVLLTSSMTMAIASIHAQRGERNATTLWLTLTAVLGVLFLGIKGVEYRIDFVENLVPDSTFAFQGPEQSGARIFFYLYYLITGVHALHVLIGVVVIFWMARASHRGAFSTQYTTPVDVTGLYWHLVDIIWLFVYPLLYLAGRT